MVSKIKTVIAETTGLNTEHETAVQASVADQAMMASYEILKCIGRIEALQFTATVSDLVIAKTFDEIKKSKQYKGLPYKDKNGNLRNVSDLEEFCQVFLGKTYRRCFELSKNLNLLGEELYEQAEQIGFTARDYQALKALPADEQAIVKQAIETEDKEHVIDLLQEMAVKHKTEKEKLSKALEDTRLELESSRNTAVKREAERSKAESELEKLKIRIKDMSPVDIGKGICKEAALGTEMVLASINGTFRKVLTALEEHQQKTGIDYSAVKAGLFIQVSRELNRIKAEFNIPDRFDDNPIPEWDREESMDDVRTALGIASED